MTELKPGRPLTRETAIYYRGRALVVRLHPGYIEVRQRGRRTGYALEYGAVYEAAGKLAARKAAEEKRSKKAKNKS